MCSGQLLSTTTLLQDWLSHNTSSIEDSKSYRMPTRSRSKLQPENGKEVTGQQPLSQPPIYQTLPPSLAMTRRPSAIIRPAEPRMSAQRSSPEPQARTNGVAEIDKSPTFPPEYKTTAPARHKRGETGRSIEAVGATQNQSRPKSTPRTEPERGQKHSIIKNLFQPHKKTQSGMPNLPEERDIGKRNNRETTSNSQALVPYRPARRPTESEGSQGRTSSGDRPDILQRITTLAPDRSRHPDNHDCSVLPLSTAVTKPTTGSDTRYSPLQFEEMHSDLVKEISRVLQVSRGDLSEMVC